MASLSERSLKRREERRHMMGNMRIPKLIPLMAVPTIISMLVSSAYNLADTFFVSSLGTAATAAVGVNAALAEVIMMAGSFLAVGANSYIARLMGAKKDKQASQVLSTSFFSAIFTGGFVMVFGLLFMEPLCYLLGATDEILHYTIDYASYVLYAAPFMASSFVLNQCLRSEGSATYSMIGMMIGAVLNIGLDPIFIFTLDLGVLGASLATAISKLVSFLVLLFPYITRRSLLHLSFKNIHYNRDIVLEITRMGSPSLLRSGLNTIAITITNNIAGAFSASALAAISVVNRVMRFLVAAILGFGQGFQPVAGFNWGARRYDRVREAYRFSSIVGVGVISAFAVLLFVFSKPVILIFTEADLEMLRIGSFCLRLQCLVMPIHAWGIV
ncbi:MAG: MATE family efflux transporter, partial [Clostridia bacterium]|nr:MATE family efflux transporter [Clostridia bacterium]